MARKEQKAPNYTAGGLELYGQATFALRQAARMLTSTVDKYEGREVPPEIMGMLLGQVKSALAMWEE